MTATLSRLVLVFAAVALAGCAAGAPLPKSIAHAPPGNVQLVEAMRNLDAAIGTRVRWGGSVVEIIPEAGGATRIEILERKLDGGGRPLNHGPSDGRFAIRAAPEVDPGRYSLGSEVTVAGSIEGTVVSSAGDTIPLVRVEDFVRWLPPLRYYDDPLYGPGPWYYDPWYPRYRSGFGVGVDVGF